MSRVRLLPEAVPPRLRLDATSHNCPPWKAAHQAANRQISRHSLCRQILGPSTRHPESDHYRPLALSSPPDCSTNTHRNPPGTLCFRISYLNTLGPSVLLLPLSRRRRMPLGLQNSGLVFAPETTTTAADASDYATLPEDRHAGGRLENKSAGLAHDQNMTHGDVEVEGRPPYLHVRFLGAPFRRPISHGISE